MSDSVCNDAMMPLTENQCVSSRNCISNINVIVAFLYKWCSFVFSFSEGNKCVLINSVFSVLNVLR